MSQEEHAQPRDASRSPKLDDDLEPFTEAAAESLPELPDGNSTAARAEERASQDGELHDLPELPHGDAMPELPSAATLRPAKPAPKELPRTPSVPAKPPPREPSGGRATSPVRAGERPEATKPAPAQRAGAVLPKSAPTTPPEWKSRPARPAGEGEPKSRGSVLPPAHSTEAPPRSPMLAPRSAPSAAVPAGARAESQAVPNPSPKAVPAPPTAALPATAEAATLEPTPVPPASDAAAAAPTGPRKLDQAPLHLRKASWIVVAGSLLPWMGSGGGPASMVGSKAVVCLGAWLLYKTVAQRAGDAVPGFIAKLAALRFVKDTAKRPKNAIEGFLRLVPSAGHLLGIALLLFGVASYRFDPRFALEAENVHPMKALAELGMLAWAAATLVHIFAYVHGAKFNPIFPLMFLAMAVTGTMGVVFGIPEFAEEGGDTALLAAKVLGALIVAAGGLFACYTMYEAMKQAKVEGEAKKSAARDARKAARTSTRASSRTK